MEPEESSALSDALKEIEQAINAVSTAQSRSEENDPPSRGDIARQIGDTPNTEPSPEDIYRQGERRYWNRSIVVQWALFLATFAAFGAALRYADIAQDQWKATTEQSRTLNGQWQTMRHQWSAMQSSNAISKNAAEANIAAISKQMRQDQRPWLRVEFPPTPGASQDQGEPRTVTNLTTGQPIEIPVRIRNTGKTPAETVMAFFMIEIVGIDDPMDFLPEPGLDQRIFAPTSPFHIQAKHTQIVRASATGIETGVIFPDSWTNATVPRTTHQSAHEVIAPATLTEMEDLVAGRRSIYLVGRITYFDEFGTPHWTDYCRMLQDIPGNGRCVRYNAADPN
jgi:hypothetical protein